MPKIVKKQEVLCFEGLNISDFLDKKFIDKISKAGLKMNAITLVFMATDNKEISPIVIGHESTEELDKKIIHINTPSGEMSNKFIKLLEEMDETGN